VIHLSPAQASRLVLREHLGLPSFGIAVAAVEVYERLPIGIPDDGAALASGRRATAAGSGGVALSP
jgi:hypothetical protein